MLCEKCKSKEATVHWSEIKNNIKKETFLCEDCAKEEKGLTMDLNLPFSIQDIFSSIMELDINNVFKKDEEVVCPKCFSTYNRFKNTGKLGCSECYKTFKESLHPIVKRIQASTVHAGKVPKKAAKSLMARREIESLKDELNKAIAVEEFEKAAEIRDKIKLLEKNIDKD